MMPGSGHDSPVDGRTVSLPAEGSDDRWLPLEATTQSPLAGTRTLSLGSEAISPIALTVKESRRGRNLGSLPSSSWPVVEHQMSKRAVNKKWPRYPQLKLIALPRRPQVFDIVTVSLWHDYPQVPCCRLGLGGCCNPLDPSISPSLSAPVQPTNRGRYGLIGRSMLRRCPETTSRPIAGSQQ